MLKRLRLKFILIVMSIVTVLFLVIFGLVLHLTRQNIERESIQMMRTLAFRPPDHAMMHRPDRMQENIRLPYFTVNVAHDGGITAYGSDYFDLTDQEQLRELVNTAEQSKAQIGLIQKYDLRFMKNNLPNAKTIVFADISSEKAMLRGLIRNAVIIGAVSYAVLFVISFLLAKWVTRPVEKTWNEQKQFIADASHELKTPLTVIITNAEMLSDQSYTEQDKAQFTDNILSTSKRMRGLVESLLELARLDNAKTQIQHSSVDFSKLLNDSLLPFEPLFYENDLMLSAEIESGTVIEGDAEKLRQVFTILLDNALKYSTPAGTVNVRMKRQNAACLLSVASNGAPLSKEECQSIFKRFYRVDQARNDTQSYGLGLPIAERIVSEHHGKIWAESGNGQNTFYVSLPL